jgi:glycosyltransferase involved in cell wall biosynthesis
MINIAIIIPAFNEEASIRETILDYKNFFPNARILVVDNNSTDATYAIAKECLNKDSDILITELRQGKGSAVKTGLSRITADIFVMTDADRTYQASDALRLTSFMLSTRADMIVGDRISGGAYDNQNGRMGHGWGNKMLTAIISGLAGQKYNDVLSGLRVMSHPFVKGIDLRSSGFQLETEMNVIAAYLRTDVREIHIAYGARPVDSPSKLNTVRDGFKILLFALKNWISFAPLQPFLIFASVMTLMSIALAIRVLYGFLETGWPYSTTAIACVATGTVGILAIFFGITLRIISRNDRRREIAIFLENKRKWNARLDENI